MPSFSIQTYSDPAQVESAHRASTAEIVPTSRGPMMTRIVRANLDGLWVTSVHETAARIRHVALSPAWAFLSFEASLGAGMVIDGTTMPRGGIMRHGSAHSYYDRSFGPIQRGVISLPADDLRAISIAVAGCDLAPSHTQILTPPPDAMARLQRLHASVETVGASSPDTIVHAEAARSLRQSLIHSMVECLSVGTALNGSWSQQNHTTVMRRFRRLLEDNPDRALYIPEVCAAIGVPDRTLRLCCQEHLKMSPKQYLALRRMHLAHRALRLADPAETTVTEVATRFGFWHFGRFSTVYRTTFGELPSATLRYPAG